MHACDIEDDGVFSFDVHNDEESHWYLLFRFTFYFLAS